MTYPDRSRQDFVQWLRMSTAQRERAGLPTHETEYAETFGMSQRTLRRWRQALPPEADTPTGEREIVIRITISVE